MSQQAKIYDYFKPDKLQKVDTNNMNQINKRVHKSRIEPTPEKKLKVCGIGTENLLDDKFSISYNNLTPSKNTVISPSKSRTELQISNDVNPVVYEWSSGKCGSSPRTSPSTFYSPTKKRLVIKRTTVKRNLTSQFQQASVETLDEFTNMSRGLGDKTLFLLTIIYKYLNDSSIRHLLDENCEELLSNTINVIKPGMTLVCRLFWRKTKWYKINDIKKICAEGQVSFDDSNMRLMLDSLVKYGYIEDNSSQDITFEEYTNILGHNEIKKICKDLKLNSKNKNMCIDKLKRYSEQTSIEKYFIGGKKHNKNSNRVMQKLTEMAGICYRLTDFARSTILKLYTLMYLGIDYKYIREKKLELLLINEKSKREIYPLPKDMVFDSASVVFQTKFHFERYMIARYIYENYLERTNKDEKISIINNVYDRYKAINEEEMKGYKILPQWLRKFTPAHLYIKILESGITELKSKQEKGCIEKALDILTMLISQDHFRQHNKGDWYNEKALILQKLKQYEEAAQVLLDGFKSNMPEDDKVTLRQRALIIARRKSAPISQHLQVELLEYSCEDSLLQHDIKARHFYKQPMDFSSKGGKLKFETRTANGMIVQNAEEYCISEYIRLEEFTHGYHWEGEIIKTIFVLLFWDIIYRKPDGVRGIFLSHLQHYPCDMFSDDFYKNRKEAIDTRLNIIENSSREDLLEFIEETFQNRLESK